jgi:hypothetical protein
MVPKIGRLLSKLGWCAYHNKIANPYEYAFAVGSCFQHLKELDIVGVYVCKLLMLGVAGRSLEEFDPNSVYKTVGSTLQCPEAYRRELLDFYQLFENEIESINADICRVDSFPCFVYNDSFNRVLEKDWFVNNVDPYEGVFNLEIPGDLVPLGGLVNMVSSGLREIGTMYDIGYCLKQCGADPGPADTCAAAIRDGFITQTGFRWLMSSLCCTRSTGALFPLGKMPGSSNTLDTVRHFKRRVIINRPPSFTGTKWNFTVFFMPYLTPFRGDAVLASSICDGVYRLTNGPGNTLLRPGWNAFAWENGTNWSTSTGVVTITGLSYDTQDVEGPTTLIGTSCVTNYTGVRLQESGSMTGATLPGRAQDFSCIVGTTDRSQVSGKLINSPALTANELARYANSNQWFAPNGFFMQPALYDCDYHFAGGEPYNLSVFPAVFDSTGNRTGWSSLRADSTLDHGGNIIPWEMPQVFLEGLTNDSEYQVTVNYIIQSSPGPSEVDEIAFVSEPAPLDFNALQMYSAITAGRSMIFPFKDNPTGEWFRRITSMLAGAFDKIRKPMIQHTLGALGGGIGALFGAPEIGVAGGETLGTIIADMTDYEEKEEEEKEEEEPPHIVENRQPRRRRRRRGRRQQLTKENSTKAERQEQEIKDTAEKMEQPLPQRQGRIRRGRVRGAQ